MASARVGLDIDGVLADFNQSFRKLIHEVSGKELIPAKDYTPVWHYPQHYGYTSKEINKVWDVIKTTSFWLDLAPYENLNPVWDKIFELEKSQVDFYFITSRVGQQVKHQTEEWLMRHLGVFPTVLISERKGHIARGLDLDYFLDDKPENWEDVDATGTEAYLINRQWNKDAKHIPDVCRVDTVLEFLEKIK